MFVSLMLTPASERCSIQGCPSSSTAGPCTRSLEVFMSAPRSPRRWGPALCAYASWPHASSQLRLSLLGAISSLALMTSATAADLSARVVPAPVVAVAPVFTWTGFYAGLNAGWGVTNGHRQFVPSNTLFVRGLPGGALLPIEAEAAEVGEDVEGSRTGGDRDGFVGGGQIGYNY